MRLISRYLAWAFLGPLLLCLISFNVIFIIFDLFGHLSKFIDSDLGVVVILRYYAGVISMYSHWFLPASCMLATLYTMWQLSHHSELTAMRASGISFLRLTLPFFVVSVVMTLLTYVNSEFITPEASTWSERLKESAFSSSGSEERKNYQYILEIEQPDKSVKKRRSWLFASVDTSTEESMSHPSGTVEVKEEVNGVAERGWLAERADYWDGQWWFHSPKILRFEKGRSEKNVDMNEVSSSSPSVVLMSDLTETPRQMMLEQRDWESISLADMYHQLLDKKADSTVSRARFWGFWGRPSNPEEVYGFWYRIFAPWACVVITLFAIPAGISTGRQSVIKGVILALAAFFSFYAVTLALKFIGHHGGCPPAIAALLPNLIFLLLGSFLYRKLT